MAKSRDNMVVSAKRLAGMENSQFVPDADWAEWVERGVEDLWEKLLKTFGAEYFLTSSTITTAASTDSYNLPSDFLQLVSIHVLVNGSYIPLNKFDWSDETNLRNRTSSTEFFYHIIGSTAQAGSTKKIMILPVPSGVYTITIRYTYKPVFASGSATIDGINGWEEYAELLAAIKALNKEGTDSSALVMDLNRVNDRISKNKASVDTARPARVADTRKDRWLTWRIPNEEI